MRPPVGSDRAWRREELDSRSFLHLEASAFVSCEFLTSFLNSFLDVEELLCSPGVARREE